MFAFPRHGFECVSLAQQKFLMSNNLASRVAQCDIYPINKLQLLIRFIKHYKRFVKLILQYSIGSVFIPGWSYKFVLRCNICDIYTAIQTYQEILSNFMCSHDLLLHGAHLCIIHRGHKNIFLCSGTF